MFSLFLKELIFYFYLCCYTFQDTNNGSLKCNGSLKEKLSKLKHTHVLRVQSSEKLLGQIYIIRNGSLSLPCDCRYKSNISDILQCREVSLSRRYSSVVPLTFPDGGTFQHFLDGVLPKKSFSHWIISVTPKLNWTASSEFGTYRLCEQRRFRRACASAQSRQNLRCSLIQAVNLEEPSDRKPDSWPLRMAGHAQLKFVMTECSKTQIRLTRPSWCWHPSEITVFLKCWLSWI